MKRRWIIPVIASAAVSLVIGGVGGWLCHKANSVPPEVRERLGFIGALKYEEEQRKANRKPTPEQVATARKLVAELKPKLLAEYPDLAIQEQPVPDDENGFRLLHLLVDETKDKQLPITKGLTDALESKTPWDPAAMRVALESNRELVARLEHIAALPRRSSSNLPASFTGALPITPGTKGSAILLAKARLAAEAKDEAEALRLTAAAFNLASHFDGVETPSMLGGIVSSIVSQQACEAVPKKLLPALGRDADLSRWRDVIHSSPEYNPERVARVMRGEWNVMMDHFMAPGLADSGLAGSPEQMEAVIRTLAAQYDYRVRSLFGQKPAVLLSLPAPPSSGIPLSAKGREVVDALWTNNASWGKRYGRVSCARAMSLATLDLLILEKSGTTLTADSASGVTLEPLTGQAFLFDPATRKLSVPSSIAKVVDMKPMALPW